MSRRVITLIVGVLLVLLLVPIAAAGIDRFRDVPSQNVFHGDIRWLADSGITRGCNPPANDKFCPESSVTRAQMAAFLHRFAIGRVVDAATLEGYTFEALATAVGNRIAAPTIYRTYAGHDAIPHDSTVTLATINIKVPGNGAIQAAGPVSFISPTFVDYADGWVWFTFDNDICDGPATGQQLWTTFPGVDSVTPISTIGTDEGNHIVRLCAWSAGEPPRVIGELVVVWVPGNTTGGSLAPLSIAETDSEPMRQRLLDRHPSP